MFLRYLVYMYIRRYEEQFYGAAQRTRVIPPCLIPQSTHNNQTNTFTNNGEHFPLDMDNHKQSNTRIIISYETFDITSIELNRAKKLGERKLKSARGKNYFTFGKF